MPKKQDPSKSMKSLLEIDALKNFMKRDKEFSPKEKKSYQPIDTRTVKDAKSMDSEDMIDMIANAIEDLSEDNIRNISSDTLKTIYLISSIERAIQNGGLEKFYDREPGLTMCMNVAKAYNTIGAQKHAAFLKEVNSYYLSKKSDLDVWYRLTEQYQSLDEKERLQKLLGTYIKKNLAAILKDMKAMQH